MGSIKMEGLLKKLFSKSGDSDKCAELPNFVIVGFGKCGTTSLHYALRGHPDICLVRSKEAHFFDIDSEYQQGVPYYLEKHFPHYNGEKAIGDITPAYVFYEKALPRIRDILGDDVKIIVIMRHPVIRAFSHYIHSIRISEDKDKFLDEQGDIVNPLYKNVSMYSQSLKNLYRIFPKENILPLVFERDVLQEGANVACRKIEDFLGVPHHDVESLNTEFAKGYLASVTVLDRKGYIELKGKRTNFNPCDVVIEHIRKPEGYYFECLKDLAPTEMAWYKKYPKNITTSLSREDVKEVYNRMYKADAVEVSKLTGADVTLWDDIDDAGDYEIISSRLQYEN